MKSVSFSEFRRNASTLLDQVERGQLVRVLRHGKPVAMMVPAVKAGLDPAWRRPRQPIASGASLSRAVLEERRAGR